MYSVCVHVCVCGHTCVHECVCAMEGIRSNNSQINVCSLKNCYAGFTIELQQWQQCMLRFIKDYLCV